MYPEAIEQALERFFESSRYQEALDAHLKLVETAFVKGWMAATAGSSQPCWNRIKRKIPGARNRPRGFSFHFTP